MFANQESYRQDAMRLLSEIDREARELRELLLNAAYIRNAAVGQPAYVEALTTAFREISRAGREATRKAVAAIHPTPNNTTS